MKRKDFFRYLISATGIPFLSSFPVRAPANNLQQQGEASLSGLEKQTGRAGSVSAEIIMPGRIYALQGTETNIYFENIIVSNIPPLQLDIDITCTKGKQLARCWRYTPLITDAGTENMTIEVFYAGTLLASQTIKICTAILSSGAVLTRKINNWGDSTLASGQPLSAVIAGQSDDPMKLILVGTKGNPPMQHEGRSGYRIADYSGAGRTLFQFNVADLGQPPAVGSVWETNGSGFTVDEVNMTGASGYFRCRRTSGTHDPTDNGVLTSVSVPARSSVGYNSYSVESGNPMWNGHQLSYSYYLSQAGISMSAGDWFTMHLGINDMFPHTTTKELMPAVVRAVEKVRLISANVRTSIPGIRCLVMVPIPPSISQDAFGENYANGQTLAHYWKNITAFQKALIDVFDNDQERDAGNYLLPYNAVVDREHNFPFVIQHANGRSTAQIRVWTNGVHPSPSGYNQMGDQLRAFLKYMS